MQFQDVTAEVDLAPLGLSADMRFSLAFHAVVFKGLVLRLFHTEVKYESPNNDCMGG